MCVAKRKVIHASSKLDNAIFLNPTIFCITNLEPFGIHTRRVFERFSERLAFIIRDVIPHRMNIFKIINLFVFCSGRADDFNVGLLSRIRNLRNTASIYRISFHLQNIKSLVQLFFRDTKFPLNAGSNIYHPFFRNLLFQEFSRGFSLVHAGFGRFVEQRTDGRIISESHLLRDFVQTVTFFPKRLSSRNVGRSSFIFRQAHLCPELRCAQAHRFGNGYFTSVSFPIFICESESRFLHLFHSRQKIPAVLVRVISRTPGITTGTSRHSVVHQHFLHKGIHGLTLLFFDFSNHLVKSDDFVHNRNDVFRCRFIVQNFIVLVQTKFYIDISRFYFVLRRNSSGL